MSYTQYYYDLPLCVGCGMAPKHIGDAWMCDQYKCPSCGKETHSYFDGAFYALDEWCQMNGTTLEATKREVIEG